MKNAALIVAHCDTEEKTLILNQNIDHLNQFKNKLDILLISYLPVSEEIISKVRYFIYDNENPVIEWPEKGIFSSHDYGDVSIHNITHDYGWCIANKIKLAGVILENVEENYNGVYFMNYDVKLSEPLLNKIDKGTPLNETFTGINFEGYIQYICTVFMSFKFDTFLELISTISRKDYMSNVNRIIEDYLIEKLEEMGKHTASDIQIYDHIDYNGGGGLSVFNSISNEWNFKLFQSTFDFTPWAPSVNNHSFIYKVKEHTTIKINDKVYILTKDNNLLLPFNIETLEVNVGGEWKDVALHNKGKTFIKIKGGDGLG
tara:strand:+ start:1205 stop:2152 length:948 start_codon:yes stop_codon:yes gene_type:complete